MEPAQGKVRFKLELGKFPVKGIRRTATGFEFALALPGLVLVIPVSSHADVREGDLLTLYTEVLVNAPPQPTSIQ